MRYQNASMGVMRFGLFGFPVHIQPGFWVVMLLLGGTTKRHLAESLALIAIVFASILTHELGHAFAARRSGLKAAIVIHALGGLTSWRPQGPITRRRAIAIAGAGPAASLLLALLAFMALLVVPRSASLSVLAQVNGFWSLVNLLPIMPFDGGQILVHILGPRRRLTATRVSLAFGCTAALVLLRVGMQLAAVVCVVAAVMQFVVTLRALRANPLADPAGLDALLALGRRALDDGDAEAAEKAAAAVIECSSAIEQRQQAAEILAWSALARGQHHKARQALEFLSVACLDPLLRAAILEADGDAERAIACLRQARVGGDKRPQVAASLIRLLLSADRYGEAALTTIQILDHVDEQEARRVMSACRAGGRPIPAAELGMALFSRSRHVDDLAWALVSYAASGDREAVDRILESAAEAKLDALALLSSPAFDGVDASSELRQRLSNPATQ
jgi:Zn-dependent protease